MYNYNNKYNINILHNTLNIFNNNIMNSLYNLYTICVNSIYVINNNSIINDSLYNSIAYKILYGQGVI